MLECRHSWYPLLATRRLCPAKLACCLLPWSRYHLKRLETAAALPHACRSSRNGNWKSDPARRTCLSSWRGKWRTIYLIWPLWLYHRAPTPYPIVDSISLLSTPALGFGFQATFSSLSTSECSQRCLLPIDPTKSAEPLRNWGSSSWCLYLWVLRICNSTFWFSPGTASEFRNDFIG